MELSAEIKERLEDGWLPAVYRDKVRKMRTRAYRMEIPERENKAEIQHTLLGVELKVGNRRLSCPDLSTARYLQVFARLGCREIAVPYDITKISHLADELESARQRTILLFEEAVAEKNPQIRGKMRAALIKEIRRELDEIGAGAAIPEFKQSTKQRKN